MLPIKRQSVSYTFNRVSLLTFSPLLSFIHSFIRPSNSTLVTIVIRPSNSTLVTIVIEIILLIVFLRCMLVVLSLYLYDDHTFKSPLAYSRNPLLPRTD
jgi:hypothetical protein